MTGFRTGHPEVYPLAFIGLDGFPTAVTQANPFPVVPTDSNGEALDYTAGGWTALKMFIVGYPDWYVRLQDSAGAAIVLGQQLAAGSIPVILTASQLATLTPPAAITGYALEAGHLANLDIALSALRDALLGSSKTYSSTPTALTTSVATMISADANYGLDLTHLILENSGTVASEVILYADNGSTELGRYYAPAGDMRGISFPTGREKTQRAVNKAWKAKMSTAGATIYFSADYVKNTTWTGN